MTTRTCLITGASSGIGAALAEHLAARGDALVLVARRKDRLEEQADALAARFGVPIEVLAADLTDPLGLAAVEARLADDSRPIDLLVNNAGFGSTGAFVELDVDREEEEVRLNVLAPVRLSHAALGGMQARGRGAILNVASVTGFQPIPGSATYAATKAFLLRFTEALAEECRGTGVSVTALCPGFTRTEFHDHNDFAAEAIPGFLWLSADAVAAAGLDGVDHRRVVVTPGLPYKLLELAAGLLPKTLVRRVGGLRFRFL